MKARTFASICSAVSTFTPVQTATGAPGYKHGDVPGACASPSLLRALDVRARYGHGRPRTDAHDAPGQALAYLPTRTESNVTWSIPHDRIAGESGRCWVVGDGIDIVERAVQSPRTFNGGVTPAGYGLGAFARRDDERRARAARGDRRR
jgi:hypothetical protein